MRITRHEVDGPIEQTELIQQIFYRYPPLPRGTSISHMRSSEHTQSEALALSANFEQFLPQKVSPDHLQALPIIGGDVQPFAQHLTNLSKNWRATIHARLQELHGCGIRIEQVVHLVPFDLERDKNGNDIIGIAHTGNVDSQCLFAII